MEQEITQAFESLQSDKAKVSFLLELIKNKESLPKEFSLKAIDFLKRTKIGYEVIAEYEEKAGFVQEAIDSCKSNNNFFRAGRIAEEHNMKEESQELYEKYIDQQVKEGSLSWMLNFAKEKGLFSKLITLYELSAEKEKLHNDRVTYYAEGAKIAKEQGFDKKSSELFLKASRECQINGRDSITYYHTGFGEAIDLANKAGDKNKIKELIVEAFERANAEQFGSDSYSVKDLIERDAERYGLIDEAINMKIARENYEGAADLAAKYKKGEVAEKLYLRVLQGLEAQGSFKHALKIAEKAGFKEKAKSLDLVVSALS